MTRDRHDGPARTRKVALITGASSGIGLATARALSGAGYSLALAARRRDRLEDAARGIRQGGGAVEVFVVDLERPGAVTGLVEGLVARFGRLDLLVNNAGWGYCGPLERMPDEAVQRIFTLNLVVPYLMMREALPHLRRSGGTIVNVSSGAGLLPSPYYAAYSATKAGLNSLSDALRLEERVRAAKDGGVASYRGIPVVCICPGPVSTEFGEAAGGAPVRAASLGVRVQEPGEIAALIVKRATGPGGTVCTSLPVRFGALMRRLMPWLLDRFVVRWAGRIRPLVQGHFEKAS